MGIELVSLFKYRSATPFDPVTPQLELLLAGSASFLETAV